MALNLNINTKMKLLLCEYLSRKYEELDVEDNLSDLFDDEYKMDDRKKDLLIEAIQNLRR